MNGEGVERVSVEIWQADAVVLYDWLMTVDLDAVPITHPAEKQALADLLSRLEPHFEGRLTQEEVNNARGLVARDMGW